VPIVENISGEQGYKGYLFRRSSARGCPLRELRGEVILRHTADAQYNWWRYLLVLRSCCAAILCFEEHNDAPKVAHLLTGTYAPAPRDDE
jgi:hypothetical protein